MHLYNFNSYLECLHYFEFDQYHISYSLYIIKSFFTDQIGSRQVLIFFVLTGFVLCGIVEQSASVALRANSTSSYSAAEFAEYVENTSYITRYCQPPSENENKSGNTSVHVVRSIPHIEVCTCLLNQNLRYFQKVLVFFNLTVYLSLSLLHQELNLFV